MSCTLSRIAITIVALATGVVTVPSAYAQWRIPPGGSSWGIAPADLAAHRIDFRLLNKIHPYKGQLQIVGVVKHVSGGQFRGHAIARLEENSGQGWKTLAQKSFNSLGPGQEIHVHHQLTWLEPPGAAVPLIRYRLTVLLGPDSRDGNYHNNVIERNSSGFGALILNRPNRVKLAPPPPRHPGRPPVRVPLWQLERR